MKFRKKDNAFYKKLDDPNTIISTLDNSGVLIQNKKEQNLKKIAELRMALSSAKTPDKTQLIAAKPQILRLYQDKKQNS